MPAIDTGYGVKGLILKGDKVLVLSKPNGGYDLPGGRVEGSENSLDCLGREIQEETTLGKVMITNCFAPWSFVKKSGLFVEGITLLCIYTDGTVRLSLEHSGFVPLKKLRSMDIYQKYGLEKFDPNSLMQSQERRDAYGDLESRRIAAGNGRRV